jgi:hypothetical protein
VLGRSSLLVGMNSMYPPWRVSMSPPQTAVES